MAENRRRIRKRNDTILAIVYVFVGFAMILVGMFVPSDSVKENLLFIPSLLIMCGMGLLYCYWGLKKFLSVYKEKDALMDVHIGHESEILMLEPKGEQNE